jgi:hypothetical protein
MSTKLTINGSWTQFVPKLRSLSDFTTHGSLRGTDAVGGTYGQLDRIYWDSVDFSHYTVYSYNTPIAWFVSSALHTPKNQSNCDVIETTGGYWVVPNDKYSVTTSKSQGRINTALSVINNSAY